MTRTETDLRDALRELERRADDHGAPSTTDLLTRIDEHRPGGQHSATRSARFPRWAAPLAAAAAVAAAAITVAAVDSGGSGPQHVGGLPTGAPTASKAPATPTATAPSPSPTTTAPPVASPPAATILDAAATKLDAAAFTPPPSKDYFYVRTNEVTTWTSVSGTKAGRGRTDTGGSVDVPGCRNGTVVSSGESGSCTLNDVPHYRADAPTVSQAWDAYLETIAPGAKAGGAQGKIIVSVLHQDLVAPKAAAALLRYTATCPGLHTITVRPVAGQKLVGVTCTSMTNGSYGLAFDATTHAFAGFVGVTQSGAQDGPAEIVAATGIVTALGDRP